MANPYYDHSTFPAPNSAGSSAAMRTELDLIEQGFDKLPTFSGNASRLIAVNATETALEAVTGNVSLPGNLTVAGSTTLGDAAGDSLTVWPSAVTWSSNPTHSGNHTWSGTHTLSAGTANQVQYLNASKVLVGSSNMTFDGTALTLGGNPTLSAGTANGVLYLNGSKVVTTGSALVFDGTNLGVGTSSPGAKLQVKSNGQTAIFEGTTARGSGNIYAAFNDPTGRKGYWGYGGGDDAFYLANEMNAPLLFITNSIERMRLDASGNLGLGVTPSAWQTGGIVKAIDLGTYAAVSQSSTRTSVWNNAYRGAAGAAFYKNNGLAALYDQDGGAHAWYNAPNNTSGAGAAATFTQAMTLDASGNLGVGATSPASRLDVTGAFGTSTTALTIYNNTASSASNIARIDFRVNNTFGGNERAAAIWGMNPNAAGNNGGALVFGTSANGTATTPTERARITSDGKFALGWPEARADLDVGTNTATAITKSIHLGFSDDDYYGFRIANTNTASLTYAGTLAFQRGNGSAWVDVATITDGGNLLINTSTIAGAGGYTFQVQAGGIAAINNNNSASTGYVFSSYRRGGTEIGSVTQNGTTAVLFNTTSDRRLKDNIVPAPSASNVIDAIEIVSHDWKSAPDEHVTFGVIAQDLALVAPQAVLQGDDGDEIEKTWGVDYSKLVPMLIKEIQSLRARVAALEQA